MTNYIEDEKIRHKPHFYQAAHMETSELPFGAKFLFDALFYPVSALIATKTTISSET